MPCAVTVPAPGARVRATREGSVDADTEFSEQQTTLYELQPVGRYGLTPVWGDGHQTGIYTYERLRATCECDDCRATRAARPSS